MKPDKISPDAVENTTRRIGLEAKLKEPVKNAVEDPACLVLAKSKRFDANGEPKQAPGPDDQKAERAKTASKGSKSK